MSATQSREEWIFCRTCSIWSNKEERKHDTHNFLTAEQVLKIAKGQWTLRVGEIKSKLEAPTELEGLLRSFVNGCSISMGKTQDAIKNLTQYLVRLQEEQRQLVQYADNAYKESLRKSEIYRQNLQTELKIAEERLMTIEKGLVPGEQKPDLLFPVPLLKEPEGNEGNTMILIEELKRKLDIFGDLKRRLDPVLSVFECFTNLQDIEDQQKRRLLDTPAGTRCVKELVRTEVTLGHICSKTRSDLQKWQSELKEHALRQLHERWVTEREPIVALSMENAYFLFNVAQHVGITLPIPFPAQNRKSLSLVRYPLYCMDPHGRYIYFLNGNVLMHVDFLSMKLTTLATIENRKPKSRMLLVGENVYVMFHDCNAGLPSAWVYCARTKRGYYLPSYPIPGEFIHFHWIVQSLAVLSNHYIVSGLTNSLYFVLDVFDLERGWVAGAFLPPFSALKVRGDMIQISPGSLCGSFVGNTGVHLDLYRSKLVVEKLSHSFTHEDMQLAVYRGNINVFNTLLGGNKQACFRLDSFPILGRTVAIPRTEFYDIKEISQPIAEPFALVLLLSSNIAPLLNCILTLCRQLDTELIGYMKQPSKRSSVIIGTIQRKLAWPLHKDGTLKSRWVA